MELHQLLHIFHLLVKRHFQRLEDSRDHPGPHYLMPVECPPRSALVPFGGRLAYIVQQCRPSEPYIRRSPDFFGHYSVFETIILESAFRDSLFLCSRHIVQDLESMREILLVPVTFHTFSTLQFTKLRQYQLQQSGLVHQAETRGRAAAYQHFVQFLRNTLPRKDFQTVPVPADRLQGFRYYPEFPAILTQPGGEPYGPDHPQRIIAVSGIGIQRRADNACSQVPYPSERIHQGAEIIFLKAECHRVYRKIPAFLIVFQRAVFHYRLSGIPSVRFFSGPDKLHFNTPVAQHCSPEIPENGNIGMHGIGHSLCQFYPAALHHDVYILARPAQKTVPDIAAYHKSPYPFRGRNIRNYAEYPVVQETLSYCHKTNSFISAFRRTKEGCRRTRNQGLLRPSFCRQMYFSRW